MVEVGQNAPSHQNMESSRFRFGSTIRTGPFLEGFVFSVQGLLKSSSPFSPPYTSMYSALKCLTPSKERKWQEGVLVVESTWEHCRGCRRRFWTDGLRRGSVGRNKNNSENIRAEGKGVGNMNS